MEAVRDFITVQDLDRGSAPAGHSGVEGVEHALALLREVCSTAAGESALWGFQAASDFAGQVEEFSRAADYLQLVAAAAVDRTRKQPTATAGGAAWVTGWRDHTDSTARANDPEGAAAASGAADSPAASAPVAASGAADSPAASAPAAASGADDGYRNTTEFLRARLRISAAEARRRLSLAGSVLPRQGFAGEPLPPAHAELGAAVAAGEVASRAATIITLALDRVRHVCDAEASGRMERALTRTAAENDPDFLVRVARSWSDALDQDGAEPSEELLRQLQGAFLRKPRHGLQHLEIFATAEQFENLLTVMNTATNPRTGPTDAPAAPEAGATSGSGTASGSSTAALPAGPGVPGGAGTAADDPAAGSLDRRSRPQRLLDGLVGACKVALASGSLPATGGLRPQVMVTIDYRDLLHQVETHRASGTGSALFTGPVTASTARKIACDADIIPVLLGGEGRILDIGRTARIFPPHIRKALTARDLGCTFPGCTIPAPWCEAHHIAYWSGGGTTSTSNGTLLCSHHHHLIHKEQWTIHVRTGIPWFIPPPHVDPRQTPRRNHYFHPARLGTTA